MTDEKPQQSTSAAGGLDPNKTTIIVLTPVGNAIEKLLPDIKVDGRLQFMEGITPNQAGQVLRQIKVGLVICHANSREEVVPQVSMLKMLRNEIKKKKVIAILTTSYKQKEILAVYQQFGVAEIFQEPINPKVIKHKLDRYIRMVQREVALLQEKGPNDRRLGKSSKTEVNEEGKREDEIVHAGEELQIKSDCWLTEGGSAKKVMGKWLMKMMGPSPAAGRWNEIKAEDSTEQYWQWMPSNPEKDVFITEEGAWTFRGHRPEFKEDHKWLFVAKKPNLCFRKDQEVVATKVQLHPEKKGLLVAKDSKAGLALLPKILESIENIIHFEGEAVDGAELELKKKKKRKTEDGQEIEEEIEEETDSIIPETIHKKKKKNRKSESPEEDTVESGSDSDLVDGKDESNDAHASRDEGEIDLKKKKKRSNVVSDIEESEDMETEATGGELRSQKKKKSAISNQEDESPELSIEVEAPPEGKELEITVERSEGTELSGRFKKDRKEGKELEATQDGPGEGTELDFREKKKKEKTGHGDITEEGPPESKELEISIEKVRPEDRGPMSFKAERPPGPSMTPLALAFLASELVMKRGKEKDYVSRRFCAYLSSSMGGLRVELWSNPGKDWVCAGTSDGSAGRHSTQMGLISDENPIRDGELIISPVHSGSSGLLGAVAVSGPGAELVDEVYLKQVSTLTRGILLAA